MGTMLHPCCFTRADGPHADGCPAIGHRTAPHRSIGMCASAAWRAFGRSIDRDHGRQEAHTL